MKYLLISLLLIGCVKKSTPQDTQDYSKYYLGQHVTFTNPQYKHCKGVINKLDRTPEYHPIRVEVNCSGIPLFTEWFNIGDICE